MTETKTQDEIAAAEGWDPDLFTFLETERFTDLCKRTTASFLVTSVAFVLVGEKNLWFGGRFNFPELVTPRHELLWDDVMAADDPVVIPDLAADPRFGGAVDVGGIPVRFFAAAPVHSPDGRRIGAYVIASPDAIEQTEALPAGLRGIAAWADGEFKARREISHAALVQRALLPKTPPPIDGYDIAGLCVPAQTVGGDFFDWYPIEGGAAFTLADVMGKGLGAGILAAAVRATLRSSIRDDDVSVALERTSDALTHDLAEAASFVTLFHARLSAEDGRLDYVDAGHGLSVLVSPDGTAERLFSPDFPLGTTVSAEGWHGQHIELAKGSTLVSFSDGVLDLYDGTLDAVSRVAEIARDAESAGDITDELRRLANAHETGDPDDMGDDITAIVIRRL